MCRWTLGATLLVCASLAAVLLPSIAVRGLEPDPLAIPRPPLTAPIDLNTAVVEIEASAAPQRPRAAAAGRAAARLRRAQRRPSARVQTRPIWAVPSAPKASVERRRHAPAPKAEPEYVVEAPIFLARRALRVEPPRGRPVLDEQDMPPVLGEQKAADAPRPLVGGKHKE